VKERVNILAASHVVGTWLVQNRALGRYLCSKLEYIFAFLYLDGFFCVCLSGPLYFHRGFTVFSHSNVWESLDSCLAKIYHTNGSVIAIFLWVSFSVIGISWLLLHVPAVLLPRKELFLVRGRYEYASFLCFECSANYSFLIYPLDSDTVITLRYKPHSSTPIPQAEFYYIWHFTVVSRTEAAVRSSTTGYHRQTRIDAPVLGVELGEFAKLRKATISFFLSARLLACSCGATRLQRDAFLLN
jgi:hypothetical protein